MVNLEQSLGCIVQTKFVEYTGVELESMLGVMQTNETGYAELEL